MLNLIKNVGTLLNTGFLKESELLDFVNTKLASAGVVLADEPGAPTQKRKTTKKVEVVQAPGKKRGRKAGSKNKKPVVEAEATGKPEKGTRAAPVRGQYTDGRTHRHAMLLAVDSFADAGCNSQEFQAKLKELGHEMATQVFHTTRSNLQNKDGLLKSSGKRKSSVYKLTAAGKKVLAELESPKAPAADEDTAAEE